MPVGGKTFDRRILMHRRHHDAVAQLEVPDGERRKQQNVVHGRALRARARLNRGILMAGRFGLSTGMLQHYYSRSMVCGYSAGIEFDLEHPMRSGFFSASMLAL